MLLLSIISRNIFVSSPNTSKVIKLSSCGVVYDHKPILPISIFTGNLLCFYKKVLASCKLSKNPWTYTADSKEKSLKSKIFITSLNLSKLHLIYCYQLAKLSIDGIGNY